MINKEDILKKLRMIWNKSDDLVIRSNLIKSYIEAILKSLGINSERYVLLITDFRNKKEMTNANLSLTTIRINIVNMHGDLERLLQEIDNMIDEMKVNVLKSEYSIDDVSKGIKR